MLLRHKTILPIALSICLFLVLVLSINAAAQSSPPSPSRSPDAPTGTGTFLTYQGQLTDKDGEPVETSVQMVFKLYDAGENVIYTSATRTVTPTRGLFTVDIGAPPDPGLTPWVLSNIAEVGVTVNDDPEMTPRQSINSVVGASVAGVGVAGNSQTSYGVYGFSQSSSAIHGHAIDGVGVSGYTSGTVGHHAGIKGDNGGIGDGVFGLSARGVGVSGHGPRYIGVRGDSETGIGVVGFSQSNIGVSGATSSTELAQAGVYGSNSGSGAGVYGWSEDGPGVYANSVNEVGVRAYSANYVALWANSETSIGVIGMSHGNDGVNGYTDSTLSERAGVKGLNGGTGPGVHGESTVGNIGVRGTTNSTATSNAGVYGENEGSGAGVYGWSSAGPAVYASSDSNIGVVGMAHGNDGINGHTDSTSTYHAGVRGQNSGSGSGVHGESTSGNIGVSGYTSGTEIIDAAVSGSNGGSGPGVYGWSNNGPGVYANSVNEVGVRAHSSNYVALWANSETSIGVIGMSHGNDGVSGYTDSTSSNHAGVKGQNGGSGPGVYGASDVGPGIYAQTITGTAAGYFTATNPSLATAIFLNGGGSDVLHLRNGGAAGSDSDGSGGGNFIQAVNSDGQDVQFRVTTSGTVESDGAYTTPAADFAEMLPAVAGVAPGDVLVIGADGQLQPSTQPYQLTVIGVYSTRPGFVGGRGIDEPTTGQVPLAIMGVVPVKVSSENGAIQPGDLLVASATPAHAMRAGANPPNGTVIGKALGTLAQGTGVIQMLVTLQ